MRIAHNIAAVNVNNQGDRIERQKQKNLEKLASGFRINRAGDDAAGLAISEKMRVQISGLDRGSLNIKEGVSLIQTAEGALEEIHSMLQRVVDLTLQAYNDTYSDEDKWKCQDEVDQLLSEITRISENTTFNGIKVLQGNPIVKNIEKIHKGAETSTRMVTTTYKGPGLPSWITYDNEMKINHGELGSNKQNTDHVAYINKNRPDEKIYGNAPGAVAPWTEDLDDNYVSVMKFDGLATAATKEDLLEKLRELNGSAFFATCSTCSDEYVLSFTSDQDPYKGDNIENVGAGKVTMVDISALFATVDALPDGATLTNEGTAIAAELVSSIASRMSAKADHFIEFQQNADNPTELLIYDWRDDGFDSSVNRFPGKVGEKALIRTGMHEVVIETPASDLEFITDAEAPLWIQASANSGDGLSMDYPSISLDTLHLLNYSVFQK